MRAITHRREWGNPRVASSVNDAGMKSTTIREASVSYTMRGSAKGDGSGWRDWPRRDQPSIGWSRYATPEPCVWGATCLENRDSADVTLQPDVKGNQTTQHGSAPRGTPSSRHDGA